MRNRNRNREVVIVKSAPINRNEDGVDYQTPTVVDEPETTEDEEESKPEQEVTDWGWMVTGTFPINVTKEVKNKETGKMEKVSVYKQDEEPFKYPKVNGLSSAIVYFGGKFSDEQVDKFGEVIGEENNDSVRSVVKIINARLKADAKTKAYQALVQKHKPLEGEDKEVAIAKMIRQTVRATNFSADLVIEMLQSRKAIPEDYTVEDYNATKLRKAKGEDDDDE